MISDPLAYSQPMIDAGADMLTFHVEAVTDPVEVAGRIADAGIAVGVALNPETPLAMIAPVLDHVDMALVMSVEAGFGGQSFNPIALEKIAAIKQSHPDLLIEIDGGIDANTIGPARSAGCDLFVVGSAIFKKDNYETAINELHQAMDSEV